MGYESKSLRTFFFSFVFMGGWFRFVFLMLVGLGFFFFNLEDNFDRVRRTAPRQASCKSQQLGEEGKKETGKKGRGGYSHDHRHTQSRLQESRPHKGPGMRSSMEHPQHGEWER